MGLPLKLILSCLGRKRLTHIVVEKKSKETHNVRRKIVQRAFEPREDAEMHPLWQLTSYMAKKYKQGTEGMGLGC